MGSRFLNARDSVGSGRRLGFLSDTIEVTVNSHTLDQYRIIVPRNSLRSKQAEIFSFLKILSSCRVVRGILLIMWLSPSDGGNVILACYCDLRYLEALTREYYVWSLAFTVHFLSYWPNGWENLSPTWSFWKFTLRFSVFVGSSLQVPPEKCIHSEIC